MNPIRTEREAGLQGAIWGSLDLGAIRCVQSKQDGGDKRGRRRGGKRGRVVAARRRDAPSRRRLPPGGGGVHEEVPLPRAGGEPVQLRHPQAHQSPRPSRKILPFLALV